MSYQIMLKNGEIVVFRNVDTFVERSETYLLTFKDERQMFITRANIVYICEI